MSASKPELRVRTQHSYEQLLCFPSVKITDYTSNSEHKMKSPCMGTIPIRGIATQLTHVDSVNNLSSVSLSRWVVFYFKGAQIKPIRSSAWPTFD